MALGFRMAKQTAWWLLLCGWIWSPLAASAELPTDAEQWAALARQDPTQALRLVDEADKQQPLPPLLKARIQCEAQRDLGRYNLALAAAQPQLDLPDVAEPQRIHLWLCAGFAADMLGDTATAASLYESARALAELLGDNEGVARAFYGRALIATKQGQELAALIALHNGRGRLAPGMDPRVQSGISALYGQLLLNFGAAAEAVRAYEDSLAHAERLDDVAATLPILYGLGSAYLGVGDLAAAEVTAKRMLALSRQHQRPSQEGAALELLLRVGLARGEVDAGLVAKLLPLLPQLIDAGGQARTLTTLTQAALLTKELAAASSRLQELRLLVAAHPEVRGVVNGDELMLQAAMAAANGQWQRAYEDALVAFNQKEQQRLEQRRQVISEYLHYFTQPEELPVQTAPRVRALEQTVKEKEAAIRILTLSLAVGGLVLLPLLAGVFWLGRRGRERSLRQPF